jgi:hypothetical protein
VAKTREVCHAAKEEICAMERELDALKREKD